MQVTAEDLMELGVGLIPDAESEVAVRKRKDNFTTNAALKDLSPEVAYEKMLINYITRTAGGGKVVTATIGQKVKKPDGVSKKLKLSSFLASKPEVFVLSEDASEVNLKSWRGW